jgi:hypothetical protein
MLKNKVLTYLGFCPSKESAQDFKVPNNTITLARAVVETGERSGLKLFGYYFGWAALFFMFSNFFELFPKGSIAWWIFWVLFAFCALASSNILGECPGLEQK